jgi:hypothetical protein
LSRASRGNCTRKSHESSVTNANSWFLRMMCPWAEVGESFNGVAPIRWPRLYYLATRSSCSVERRPSVTRNGAKAKSRAVFEILRRSPHRLNQFSNRLCCVMGQSSCEELCCAPRGTRAPSERGRMFQMNSAFANMFLAAPLHLVLFEKGR